MSQSVDGSFNPFALHPFTSCGSQMTAPVARMPTTSSPIKQAQQYQKQSRQSPATPPGGYVPQAPAYSQPPPRQPSSSSSSTKHVFDVYKADGRRTPDLSEILNKNGGQRWK
ncbi:hypothetical protein FRB94_002022 [Tulasnella sp. JGI-2019a]|nr:hypothetical protein FRB93_003753 [Tulasnella sp. JGI-2019a]KAG9004854.1 hypothetical protein FRB94_002022 [Tulasnella sp. JGI-2019a]KAG9032135.1 hypothetical protein FRB95_001841 [Tulasnella sp. JGI-2019a]